MARFDVFRQRGSKTGLLLQVQSDFHHHLDSRVVVPLMPSSQAAREYMEGLTPRFDIAGESYQMMTADMGAVLV